MKKRSRIGDGINTIVFMAIVTFVFISAVSGLHLLTLDRVALNESLFMKKAVMQAVNAALPGSAAEVDDWYGAYVRPVPDRKEPEYFEVGFDGSRKTIYVLRCTGKGLWGTITAVVALRDDLETIEGASFLHHNETPGLGARIAERWFTDQLTGKTAPIRLMPERTRSEDPCEIDAITGATVTSVAVRNMLNDAIETCRLKVGRAERVDE